MSSDGVDGPSGRRQATTVWGSVEDDAGTHPLPLVVAGGALFAVLGGAFVSTALRSPLLGLIGLALLVLSLGVSVVTVLERRWNRARCTAQGRWSGECDVSA